MCILQTRDKAEHESPLPRKPNNSLIVREQPKVPTPKWHAKWELSTVISGHLGWVRSIAFDPSNEWFATGSVDRTIKVNMSFHLMLLIG